MIKGFRGTSLVDYPGKIASVIYTYGCNFRCPYCYNIELVLPEYYRDLPDLFEEDIISNLEQRKGFIQGVVISGGEPTIWGKRLYFLLERLKHQLELPVKLDTNGGHPEILQWLLTDNIVDYVAMDIKTSPTKYHLVGGNWEKIKTSLEILKEFPSKVELRLTLYPPLFEDEDLEEILPYLENFKNIALQKYLPEKNLSGRPTTPFAESKYEEIYLKLKTNLPKSQIIRRF